MKRLAMNCVLFFYMNDISFYEMLFINMNL